MNPAVLQPAKPGECHGVTHSGLPLWRMPSSWHPQAGGSASWRAGPSPRDSPGQAGRGSGQLRPALPAAAGWCNMPGRAERHCPPLGTRGSVPGRPHVQGAGRLSPTARWVTEPHVSLFLHFQTPLQLPGWRRRTPCLSRRAPGRYVPAAARPGLQQPPNVARMGQPRGLARGPAQHRAGLRDLQVARPRAGDR